jgi:hypothetical protein
VPLPKRVQDLFNDPAAIKVLATSSPQNVVHVIPVGSMGAPDANTIVFASIFMKEAHENLEKAKGTGGTVSVLAAKAVMEEAKFLGFQARCKVKDYDTSGPVYKGLRDMLSKLGLQVRGAWILEPVEVINQSVGPEVGEKIA